MANFRPCQHPDCKDVNGNPRLTDRGMCDRCYERLPALVEGLVADYKWLKAAMPRPPAPDDLGRKATPTGWGHPAAWASAICADIAFWLHAARRLLAEAEDKTPPERPGDERTAVALAHRAVNSKLDQFTKLDGAGEIVAQWLLLRKRVRVACGLARDVTWIPQPCPNPACGDYLVFWIKDVGFEAVRCEKCGQPMQLSEIPEAA
ncbi:conserved hypothetical protein [Segniliparus rotundus DSM 44985]|uniref:Uncharacterized protein n=1 Tax=Segniliparus rotundus (strain ATCC BAA-972 / CDC 1076 / CIP 108378 / DSM 44985 / JCM 13578) TaxID=640132 RepID=D6ZAR4_SEGRD|nr:hypothetical protein [Segniliparus rotundus]ADG98800.1 conserved hypothetical protein [Segniliparus rotundus DSM 44985]